MNPLQNKGFFQRKSIKAMICIVILLTLTPLIIRYLSFKGPILPPEPMPAGIVDIHVHTAGVGAGGSGCFVSENMRNNFRFSAYLRAFGVNLEELEEEGDAIIFERISSQVAACSEIEAVVILAMDGIIADGKLDRQNTEIHIPNDFVARETAKYGNLLFGASINPYRSDWREHLKNADDQGAVLIKWLPSIQHIDPADPELKPFYRELARLGLPLLTHTGDEHSFTHARNELADPKRLESALKEGVIVIAAHAATNGQNEGEANFDRLAQLMSIYPNLYADISSLTQINKYDHLAPVLSNPTVRKRLVYGSDFPLGKTPLVSAWYHPQRLSFGQMMDLAKVDNAWQLDLLQKQALGVPAAVFSRTKTLIRYGDDPTTVITP